MPSDFKALCSVITLRFSICFSSLTSYRFAKFTERLVLLSCFSLDLSDGMTPAEDSLQLFPLAVSCCPGILIFCDSCGCLIAA